MSIYEKDYKLSESEFLTALNTVSKVSVTKYSPKKFNELFCNGTLKPIETTFNVYKPFFLFDSNFNKKSTEILKDIDLWSTYDRCSRLNLYYLNDKECRLSIKIYDGDLLDGDPIDKRWYCEFIIPIELAYELYQQSVLLKFKRHLEAEYQIFLEKQERTFCEELSRKILIG